jgi:hypothetical protein
MRVPYKQRKFAFLAAFMEQAMATCASPAGRVSIGGTSLI